MVVGRLYPTRGWVRAEYSEVPLVHPRCMELRPLGTSKIYGLPVQAGMGIFVSLRHPQCLCMSTHDKFEFTDSTPGSAGKNIERPVFAALSIRWLATDMYSVMNDGSLHLSIERRMVSAMSLSSSAPCSSSVRIYWCNHEIWYQLLPCAWMNAWRSALCISDSQPRRG